ncbi:MULTISPECIES: AzlD domain-containing protein [Acidaminococcus]|nr:MULTISPECIES: AzlD domain-containing protein [Acidaminococcus]ERL20246.1 branched-chain amino acid transport protein AzlD domain protein [Acidaminococcus sp. BV3L6]
MNDFWESFRLANSYSNTYAMGAIFAMALATFLPRFFPMVLLKTRTLPL